jgi:Flp pilus assembly protein TadG
MADVATKAFLSDADERGSVTAETAVTIPVLAAFTLCLCWLVSLGLAQVRVVDAARDAARAAARGDQPAAVESSALRTAPGGRVDVTRADGLVTVAVSTVAEAPGWLLVPLPTVTVRAESTVLAEDSADALP